jgi:hypothetical protein
LTVEVISIDSSGAVTLKLSAREAADVRRDLGEIWGNKISAAGDELHRLLEWATPVAGKG